MDKLRYELIFIIIVVFSFVIRFVALDNYPNGFTQDEAGLGYSAYSLLLTGKDEWGSSYPLTLRSFGDFKMPVYSYLTVPTVAIFGLNEFAVRFPSVLFGVFAVAATYLLILELTKNKKLALLSCLFLAMSPWHISLSRGAFEANLTTFFIPAGILAFLKGLKNPAVLLLAALFFGTNLFTYHSARIFTPILLVILVYFYKDRLYFLLKKQKERKIIFLAILFLFVFFIASFGSSFGKSLTRPLDITIFNPTGGWGAVADRRYEAVGLGMSDVIARAFSNKVNYVFDLFIANYISYLSPVFLFIQGSGEWTYGMIPGQGVLYIFEAVFLIYFFVNYIKGNYPKYYHLLLLWVLISPLPAALSKGPGFAANRAALMMPAIQILSAQGAISLYLHLNKNFKPFIRHTLFFLFLFFVLYKILFFFENYFVHAPIHQAKDMHYGVKEAILYANEFQEEYENVFVSRAVSVPNIWVAFYQKWDPLDYQRESVDWLRYEQKSLYLDQLEGYKLGKYTFGSISADLKNTNTLIIGRPWEFKSEIETLRIILYPDGSPAYYIVDSGAI